MDEAMDEAAGEIMGPAVMSVSAVVAAPTDAVVDAWFHDAFDNHGLEAQEYNRIRDAVNKLKATLAGIVAR